MQDNSTIFSLWKSEKFWMKNKIKKVYGIGGANAPHTTFSCICKKEWSKVLIIGISKFPKLILGIMVHSG